MWNSLLFFSISAFLLAGVFTGPVKQTIIITNNANAASSAAASAGQGGGGSSAGSSSAASSGSTALIKNEHIIKCAKNERYEQCPERMCEPQLCDEEPVTPCSSVQPSSQANCRGPPACVCIANYVRNDFGACIPIQNCGNPTEPEPTEDPGDGTCGTKPPGTVTAAPGTETTAPGTGTTAPGTGTPAPDTGTTGPGTGTPTLSTRSTAPGTGTTAPGTGTTEPGTGTSAPGPGTTAPGTGTTEPGTGTTAPGAGTPTRSTRSTAPGTETTVPGTGTTAPSIGTPTLSSRSTAPGTGTTAPGTGTTVPGTGTTKPGTGTTKPGTVKTAPGTGTTEPETGTTVPSTGNPNLTPGTETTAPCTGTTEPETGTTAPGIGTPTLSTRYTAPGTGTTAPDTGTTESPATPSTSTPTTKGPNECKGKNEWYFKCPPACPQKTCSEFLNGTSCSPKTSKSCVGECRCLIGFYRDDSGNCLSGWECREAAKTTTQSPLIDPVSPFSDDCSSLNSFLMGSMAFTPKLLDSLMKRNPGNDVLVGGASILFTLAQTALYAKDAPKHEILKALRFNNTKQIRCFFPKFAVELREIAIKADLDFDYFCKIYADDRCQLTSQFKDEIEELFTVRPRNLNFTAPASAQQINNEVALFTNNSITNFVKPKVLSSLDSLMMADALSFKGEWLRPFNPKDTELKYFFGPEKVVKKLIMHQRTKMLYYDSVKLGAQIINMPYKADINFKLMIILPRTIHGLPDLMNRLKNAEVTAEAALAVREEEVDIYLPKFNVTVANLLKIPTESANVSLIFNNATAGLENVASCDKSYVSEILQKVTLQVDESGVGSSIVDFPVPEEQTTPRPSSHRVHSFNANRPFVFYLIHHKLLLASGAIVR